MDNLNIGTTFANCKVSSPILYPGKQSIGFNGFAWSNTMGMIHETNSTPDTSLEQWLGTQQ
jgi:hypothetical protein